MASLRLLLMVTLGTWLMCTFAIAQPKAAAAETDYDSAIAAGLRAYTDGQFSRSRELFQRAHTLNPSARTLRALGLTAVELKQYATAREELTASLTDTRQPLTTEQHDEVARMLAWLKSTFAVVHVDGLPSQAQVSIDGSAVMGDAVLEVGSHELRVTADGYEPFAQALEVRAGEERTLQPALERAHLQPQAATLAVTESVRADARAFTSDQPRRDTASSGSLFTRWWFWTAVGVAVVAGGTVAAVALTSKRTPAEEPGIVIGVLRSSP